MTAIASRVVANQRYQVIVVELGRGLEQHAGAMARSARGGMHGPGGIAQCDVEVLRVRSLVFEPVRDQLCERELGEGTAHLRCQLPLQADTV